MFDLQKHANISEVKYSFRFDNFLKELGLDVELVRIQCSYVHVHQQTVITYM